MFERPFYSLLFRLDNRLMQPNQSLKNDEIVTPESCWTAIWLTQRNTRQFQRSDAMCAGKMWFKSYGCGKGNGLFVCQLAVQQGISGLYFIY